MDDGNRVIVAAWNAVLYEKFCRFRHLLVEGLSAHSDAAQDRYRYPQGARMVDIGCAFGDSTLQIAGQLGSAGEAVSMDCAQNFIRACEADARRNNIASVRVYVGNAESDELQRPFDHAFSGEDGAFD